MKTVCVASRDEVIKVSAQLIAEYNIKYAGVDDLITPREIMTAVTKAMYRETLEKLVNDLPE